MEEGRSCKQINQCLRILEFAEDSRLTSEERTIVKEAVCEYFPAEVVDKVLAELIQKSRS